MRIIKKNLYINDIFIEFIGPVALSSDINVFLKK